MKRFMVFAGEKHYPWGGADDFIEDFGSETIAIDLAEKLIGQEQPRLLHGTPVTITVGWAQVFDARNRRIIWDSINGKVIR